MNDASYINDMRTLPEFRGITFSGYKLVEVVHTLTQTLANAKIEESCYWSAELVCSGHLKDLCIAIIIFYGKYINTANPKLAVYLHVRINSFIDILKNECISSELLARNNAKIRNLFCELVCVLCESTHGPPMSDVKVKSPELQIANIREKLRAPNVTYVRDVFKDEDPKDLYIAINELGYQLSADSVGGGYYLACYWVEWIVEYSKQCKQKNVKCLAMRRAYIEVDATHQMDCIWIVWECITEYALCKKNDGLMKIIDGLLGLYTIGYTGLATYSRRRHLVYCAIHYITSIDRGLTLPMISEKTKALILSVRGNINKIYQQIKKNEHSPNTDYLFSGLSKAKKLEDTLHKIQMMNSISIPTVVEDVSEESSDK